MHSSNNYSYTLLLYNLYSVAPLHSLMCSLNLHWTFISMMTSSSSHTLGHCHTHTHTRTHTHTHTHTRTHTYTHIYNTYICIYVCICMYVDTHIYTHIIDVCIKIKLATIQWLHIRVAIIQHENATQVIQEEPCPCQLMHMREYLASYIQYIAI